MARRKGIRLCWHKQARQFYKTIGFALGKDGSPKKKVWYLGDDEAAAAIKAADLIRRWKALRASGKRVWDEDPDYVRPRSSEPDNRSHSHPDGKPTSVAEAVKLYLDHLEQHYKGGQFTKQHFTSQRERLNKAISLATDAEPPLSKRPLSIVTEPVLRSAVLRLCQRPLVKWTFGEGSDHRMTNGALWEPEALINACSHPQASWADLDEDDHADADEGDSSAMDAGSTWVEDDASPGSSDDSSDWDDE